jgi:hypothetical protein
MTKVFVVVGLVVMGCLGLFMSLCGAAALMDVISAYQRGTRAQYTDPYVSTGSLLVGGVVVFFCARALRRRLGVPRPPWADPKG